MKLIYDADITVNSVIDNLSDDGFIDGEPEINIISAKATVKADGDKTEITYTEESEDSKTFCTLTVDGERVLLSRRGAVECDLTFKEGEGCSCIYRVPPYAFDMTVHTLKIRTTVSNANTELQLIYLMNIGGQNKKVRMKISVKNKD